MLGNGGTTLLLPCLSRKKHPWHTECSEKEAQKASRSAGELRAVHAAHPWDHALLNRFNHPIWALSLKSAFSCQGWSAVSWALLLSQGGTRSPTGEGVLLQLDGAPALPARRVPRSAASRAGTSHCLLCARRGFRHEC